MHPETKINVLAICLGLLFVISLGSNVVLYAKLHAETGQQLNSLQSSITGQLEQERDYQSSQLGIFKNETLDNFRSLQDAVNAETNRLKLNLESKLDDVSSDVELVKARTDETGQQLGKISKNVGQLQERSSELESQISEIDVESSDFSAIVQDVVKAVVSIRTDKGQGSGVFFDSRGYIMTNKHVIDGASVITVVDSGSRQYPVEIIGAATSIDLAVLKINADVQVPYLEFANSPDIAVGSRVIAVGNPLGLSFSVTEGIISAVNRKVDASNVGYIQTDVPINPGNSGGPLVNARKEIVGINTIKASNTEGIGFAIPADVVENIAGQAVS